MRLRRRTLARLAVPALLAVTAAVVLVNWRATVLQKRAADVAARVADGTAAFREGEWSLAVLLLSPRPGELLTQERHLMLAEATQRNGEPVAAARSALTLLLELDLDETADTTPTLRRLKRHLRMAAAATSGETSVVLSEADAALADDPEDVEALRQRRDALTRLGRHEGADAARDVVVRLGDAAAPADVLAAMRALDPAQALTLATELTANARVQGRGLPRALLGLAEANRRLGRDAQAQVTLDQAVLVAGGPTARLARMNEAAPDGQGDWSSLRQADRPDVVTPAEVLAVTAALDAAGRHDDALDLLEAAARAADADDATIATAAVRLRHAGRPDAASAVAALAGDSMTGNGLRVFLDPDRAGGSADVHDFPDDTLRRDARAWRAVATHDSPMSPTDAAAVYARARADIARVAPLPGRATGDLTHPALVVPVEVLHARAARAAELMAEWDVARSAWADAARVSIWDQPWSNLFRLDLRAGRIDDAERSLTVAEVRSRDPESYAPQRALLAHARWRLLRTPDALEAAAAAFAGMGMPTRATTSPEVAAAAISVLAARASSEAVALAEKLSESPEPRVRLAAARAAYEAGFGLDIKLPHGLTDLDDMYEAASLLQARDGHEAAAAYLAATGGAGRWASARLLEARTHSSAPGAWRAWVNEPGAAADDPRAWASMLDNAASLRGDAEGLDLLETATWRLRELTAASGVAGRADFEAARLLLDRAELAAAVGGPRGEIEARRLRMDAAEQLLPLASSQQPGTTGREARRRLAATLLRIGAIPAARLHTLGLAESPADAAEALELLDALDRLGMHDSVLRVMRRLTPSQVRAAPESVRATLARRLADAGMAETARQFFLDGDAVSTRLVQVDVLRRAGDEEAADDLLRRLANAPDATPAALLEAAVWLGDTSAGWRLDLALADEADRLVVRAVLSARRREPRPAAYVLRRLPQAAPGHAAPWRAALGHCLGAEDYADASRLAAAAGVYLREPDPRTRTLALIAAAQPIGPASDAQRVAAAARALGDDVLLAAAMTTPAAWDAAAWAAVGSAALIPEFVPLHRLLHDAHVAAGNTSEAARVVARAASDAPLAADLQRLAYSATRRNGDTASAFAFARSWRSLLAADDPAAAWADTAVADGLVLRGRHAEAVAIVAPRLESGLDMSDASSGHVLALSIESYAALGRAAEARRLVAPHLGRDDDSGRGWRNLVARLAAEVVDDGAEARALLTLLDFHVRRLNEGSPRVGDELGAAVAWGLVGIRFDDADALRQARIRLTELAARPALSRDTASGRRAWDMLGRVETHAGRFAAAEAAWRRLLVLVPGDPAAANELAHLLLTRPAAPAEPADATLLTDDAARSRDKAAEALAYARIAIAASPEVATYHDTHARALAANGASAADVRAAFEEALRLDDDYLDALLGLASLEWSLAQVADISAADGTGDDAEDWYEGPPTTRGRETLRQQSAAAAARERAATLFTRLRPLYELATRGSPVEPHLAAEFRTLADAFAGADAGRDQAS